MVENCFLSTTAPQRRLNEDEEGELGMRHNWRSRETNRSERNIIALEMFQCCVRSLRSVFIIALSKRVR